MKCAAWHNEMVKKRGEIDLRIEGKLYLDSIGISFFGIGVPEGQPDAKK